MNEEVSIKLQGGLGNYMFQMAAAYAYAIEKNKKPVFSITDAFVGHKSLSTYKSNILQNVPLVESKQFVGFQVYTEPNFTYNEIPDISGNIYLDGYFQSEKYFKKYEAEIRHLFSYPSNVFDDVVDSVLSRYKINLNSDNTCSLHVRRGDYLNFPDKHPTQNMNYYMKAIKKMPSDTIFLIFSNDIPWCKENFPDLPEKFIFIEGSSDFEDLLAMSLCKNNIICNSSFSWWAAWLNKNSSKTIIAPSKWFGPAIPNDTSDLYCENWIKI